MFPQIDVLHIGTSKCNNLTGQLFSFKSHLCNDESPKLQKERIWQYIYTGLEMTTIALDCNARNALTEITFICFEEGCESRMRSNLVSAIHFYTICFTGFCNLNWPITQRAYAVKITSVRKINLDHNLDCRWSALHRWAQGA